MSVSFNPTPTPTVQADIKPTEKEEPKTSLFKIPSVKKLILGAFAIQGAIMMPRAEAGAISYMSCMGACSLTPLTPAGCALLCAPAWGLPA